MKTRMMVLVDQDDVGAFARQKRGDGRACRASTNDQNIAVASWGGGFKRAHEGSPKGQVSLALKIAGARKRVHTPGH